MALDLFRKKKNKADKPAPEQDVVSDTEESGSSTVGMSAGIYPTLRGIYVSEKSSRLAADYNQYVFEVAPSANKSEIAKQVGRLYSVKVTDVKVMNMPRKRRDIGKHPGFRSGYRKAIVTLQDGQSIGAAKP